MRVAIVDDEAHIIKILKHYLSKIRNIEIVATAQNIQEAVEVIIQTEPDTLFLDIELEDGLSFDILKQLPYNKYNIVFVTAHAHYAIQAIRYSAFDYILKPIKPIELENVITRLLKTIKKQSIEQRLIALEKNIINQHNPNLLVLSTAEKYIIINQNDIIHLEANNTYTNFSILDKKNILVSRSIKHFEELLPKSNFIRTHRSHIININHVSEYIKTNGGYIKMINDEKIPLSISCKAEFLAKFKIKP